MPARRPAALLALATLPLLAGPAMAQSGSSADTGAAVVAILLVAAVFLALYFLPTFVAFSRQHPNRWPIFLINLVFGGTVLGWIGSLIWALHAVHVSRDGSNGGESGLNLAVNDVRRVRVEPPLPAPSHAPAPAVSHDDIPATLTRIKALHDSGAIDAEEYRRLRQPYLDRYLAGTA